jgi:hypothetical protein
MAAGKTAKECFNMKSTKSFLELLMLPLAVSFVIGYVVPNRTAQQYSIIQADFDSTAPVVDLRASADIAETVEVGKSYRRRFSSAQKMHIYLLSAPAGVSTVTVWTEGNLDTRINALTAEGLAVLLQSRNLPAGASLGSDDDSGNSYNAWLTVTVPGSGNRAICFLVDEVNTNEGEYTFTVQSGR